LSLPLSTAAIAAEIWAWHGAGGSSGGGGCTPSKPARRGPAAAAAAAAVAGSPPCSSRRRSRLRGQREGGRGVPAHARACRAPPLPAVSGRSAPDTPPARRRGGLPLLARSRPPAAAPPALSPCLPKPATPTPPQPPPPPPLTNGDELAVGAGRLGAAVAHRLVRGEADHHPLRGRGEAGGRSAAGGRARGAGARRAPQDAPLGGRARASRRWRAPPHLLRLAHAARDRLGQRLRAGEERARLREVTWRRVPPLAAPSSAPAAAARPTQPFSPGAP
jgi:hypothetical protein